VDVTEIHDLKGKVPIDVPARDSWVVIVAMGLKDENSMSPVSVDIPFGEIQLSLLAANAFSLIPVVKDFFTAPPTVPDWSPIIPYAITTPIYIDTDGNGHYDAPFPLPDFCSKKCDPAKASKDQCPADQTCLEREHLCGVNVPGRCDHRRLATCANLKKDGMETDVDCGGPECSTCDSGQACATDRDCTSGKCSGTCK